jgi:dCMP deaminase
VKNWYEYYMGFARHAATASKDSTQVGAVLVGRDGEVRLTGYNGPPRGVVDSPERFVRPDKLNFVSHAEANIIAFAAREGIKTRGCELYCTHYPCAGCARSIIQAGITRVLVGPSETSQNDWGSSDSRLMFAEAGVWVGFVSPPVSP